mgnify:CR=1 FL=1
MVATGGLAATLVAVAVAPGATAADETLPVKDDAAVERPETLVAGVVYTFEKTAIAGVRDARTSASTHASVRSAVQSSLKARGVAVDGQAAAVDAGATWALNFSEPLGVDAAQAAVAAVKAVPGITGVEPNYLDQAFASPVVPKDEYVKKHQWNIWDYSKRGKVGGVSWPNGGYSTHATALWPATKGKNVVVAVLDTGRTAHPQIDGITVAGYDMVSNASRARDGDGRDANPQDQGDWYAGDASSWHGTHVAGIIGAKWDGARGVGVAPGVRLQHVRVLAAGGGTSADIAAGITWASGGVVSGTSKNRTPAKVINLSLGGRHACGQMTQRAIDNARKRGSVVVVAAGNAGESASYYGPANCKGVITVAATDEFGQRAAYSNYGNIVDIAAPGGDHPDAGFRPVLSTWNDGTTKPRNQTWGWMMGTSQAAPHVSAAAAMLYSLGLKGTAVESALKKATSPFPKYQTNTSYNCTTSRCGTGWLNLQKVLAPVGDVKVSGTAKVGQTVTAKYDFAGKVEGYKFQWYRNGNAIKGATGKTRTLNSADKGAVIKVKVTPVGSKSYVSIAKYSAGTKVG